MIMRGVKKVWVCKESGISKVLPDLNRFPVLIMPFVQVRRHGHSEAVGQGKKKFV